MTPVTIIEGKAYPFAVANVDTDVIISSEWLKTVSRSGLGKGAFEALRRDGPNVFDDPAYEAAPILLAGENFGCGSSREHAAWALLDMGIKAIIAPSFSDIFSGNAFKNGLLTAMLPARAVDLLVDAAKQGWIRIDLQNQVVTTPFHEGFAFEIDAFRKNCLINGLDEIELTLVKSDAITRYEFENAKLRGDSII